MAVPTISPADLAPKCKAGGVMLIDVRTPAEFEEVHAEGARSVPLDRPDPKALAAECRDGECVYVICRSGGRGRQACEKLLAAGFPQVVNVEGGTLAWEQAGLPVVRGRQTMSLERQVRIATGLIVVAGAALTLLHPAFVLLAGIAGAGLIYAGVTDTCPMAMTLAKMPWNRRGPSNCCAKPFDPQHGVSP